MSLAYLLADTPQWVVDGKNYLGFGGSIVAAFGLVWRYAIKPYLEHREAERKRDIADAAAMRRGEVRVALLPLEESIRVLETEVKRTGDKMILQGDAIHGINTQLASLMAGQQSLHKDVRAHMEAEDITRQRNEGDGK